MMTQGQTISGVPLEAVLAETILAQSFMSPEDTGSSKGSIKKNFDPKGKSESGKPTLFKPEEMDIYCDRKSGDVYFFHGKIVDYDTIDYLEFNRADYSMDVVLKNGERMDLGVKIQWLVRPWIIKAQQIMIVRTVKGESVDGRPIPLKHKELKK